jgi:MFS transporter, Spinster family, sphingosine-1-phosphate transporter
MGGSPEDAQADAQRVVVVAAGSPVADSAPPPPPAPAAEGKPEWKEVPQKETAPAPAKASPVEAKQGVQAMAVTVVRDVETGVDTSTSDGAAGEKPSWFTPKRY